MTEKKSVAHARTWHLWPSTTPNKTVIKFTLKPEPDPV